MRPPWPRLALRSLVRAASQPWLASLRVARSGETFNSVSFRFISSHFVSFLLSARAGDARFPAFAGNDGGNRPCTQATSLHVWYGYQECVGVAKLLVWFRFVPFRSISHRLRGPPLPRQGSHPVFLWRVLVFGHFRSLPHLWRARFFRSDQKWGTPMPWPDMARYGLIYS